jgi:hypothetical protein
MLKGIVGCREEELREGRENRLMRSFRSVLFAKYYEVD